MTGKEIHRAVSNDDLVAIKFNGQLYSIDAIRRYRFDCMHLTVLEVHDKSDYSFRPETPTPELKEKFWDFIENENKIL